MNHVSNRPPAALAGILQETEALGFAMSSEAAVGAFLAALAATKPGGQFLELGTGTGHGTAWLLSGMNSTSTLDTVDIDEAVGGVARRHLGVDSRVRFHLMDGAEFIERAAAGMYDLIYADAWPGKFTHLAETLALLRPGGVYVVDDLLPQPNWPDGHGATVHALVAGLHRAAGFTAVQLAWASGLMLAVRRPDDPQRAAAGNTAHRASE